MNWKSCLALFASGLLALARLQAQDNPLNDPDVQEMSSPAALRTI